MASRRKKLLVDRPEFREEGSWPVRQSLRDGKAKNIPVVLNLLAVHQIKDQVNSSHFSTCRSIHHGGRGKDIVETELLSQRSGFKSCPTDSPQEALCT